MAKNLVDSEDIKIENVGGGNDINLNFTNEVNEKLQQIEINKENIANLTEIGENYLKFSNGILICWGTVTIGQIPITSEIKKTITLPQNYVDSNYSCMLTKKGDGGYWTYVSETILNITTSSFKISVWNNANNIATLKAMDYFTIGKWK